MAPTFSQLTGTTFFMIKSTFGDKAEMDLASFREMVLRFADIDDRYPQFVTRVLIEKHYYDEARYFAEKFRLQNFIRSLAHMGPGKKCPTEQPAPSNLFYELPISEQAISFVDTLQKFRSAFNYLLSNLRRESVGVDSEWPPNHLPNTVSTTSILQLATNDRVYLIDLDNLSSDFLKEDWALLKRFFSSPEIKKITFGFNSDVATFKQSFPQLGDMKLASNVDLEQLVPEIWDALRVRGCGQISPSLNATANSVSPKNLSEIARTFLGKPVNKMFRMSNWNRRPLARGQLLYAAIDAYCLLDIYREICHVISTKDLLVPHHISLLNRDDVEILGAIFEDKVKPENVSMICDCFLWDLGVYLQKLGFDVELVEENLGIAALGERAKVQKRIVLTVQHHLSISGTTSLYSSPDCYIIGVPIRDIREQCNFIANCLNVEVTTDVQMNYFDNPIGVLDNLSKERGLQYLFDCKEDPSRPQSDTVYTAHLSFKPMINPSPGGSRAACSTFKTKAIGRSKREAINRAAANMIVKLGAAAVTKKGVNHQNNEKQGPSRAKQRKMRNKMFKRLRKFGKS